MVVTNPIGSFQLIWLQVIYQLTQLLLCAAVERSGEILTLLFGLIQYWILTGMISNTILRSNANRYFFYLVVGKIRGIQQTINTGACRSRIILNQSSKTIGQQKFLAPLFL
jgi:hypothetical protein